MPESANHLDRARLSSFTGGDAELERELIELYIATGEGYLRRLEASLGDQAGWRAAAHALKGASANLGAVEVARLARTAEQASPQAAMLRALVEALEAFRAEVRAVA